MFDCARCPSSIRKLRRCQEDRWDFTSEDASFFPMRINEGGGLYGFCPAKATWDQEAIGIFELMIVAIEQKAMLVVGGIGDQPAWFVSFLAWFGPAYDSQKFISRARMVLGDGTTQKNPGKPTVPSMKGKRR